jgi:putative transposase
VASRASPGISYWISLQTADANGSEVVSGVTDHWAYKNQVKLDLSRPGKPVDNTCIESFNARFHEECLNTHSLESIDEAGTKIDAWKRDYDETRPHRALKGLSPRDFVRTMLLESAADSRS